MSHTLHFYSNTDTVDIDRKQIGVSSGGRDREFSVGVRHHGTKASVTKATQIADIIARALNAAIESGELKA